MRQPSFSPSAKADLRAIFDHIFAQDPTKAAITIDRIEATVESLCVFPLMGKQTTRTNVWVFGGSGRSPFRVSYRFDDQTLTVLRVFRSSRNRHQFEA